MMEISGLPAVVSAPLLPHAKRLMANGSQPKTIVLAAKSGLSHLKPLGREPSCAQPPASVWRGRSIPLFPARSPLCATERCINIAAGCVEIAPSRNLMAVLGRLGARFANHDRPGPVGGSAMTMTGKGCAPCYRGVAQLRRRSTFSQGSRNISQDLPLPPQTSL